MSNLDRRMRDLDRIESPELWPQIRDHRDEARSPMPDGSGSRRARAVVIVVALLVAFASTAVVMVAFSGGGARPSSPTGPNPAPSALGHPMQTSRLFQQGELRCTATFPSSVVRPGDQTGAKFTLTNVSDHVVKTTSPLGTLDVRRAFGMSATGRVNQELVNTSIVLVQAGGGAIQIPERLRPGASLSSDGIDTSVVWPGELRVIPSCSGTILPPVLIKVNGLSAVRANDAIERATAATGDALANCLPRPNGTHVATPVVGKVRTLSGGVVLARCGALVRQYPGFDVVGIQAVTPVAVPPIHIAKTLTDPFSHPKLPEHGRVGVAWWVYVVRPDSVVRVLSLSERRHCAGTSGSFGPGMRLQGCDRARH